jgi:hypothetical protein
MPVPVRGTPGLQSLGRKAGAQWFAENDPEGVAFEYEVLE